MNIIEKAVKMTIEQQMLIDKKKLEDLVTKKLNAFNEKYNPLGCYQTGFELIPHQWIYKLTLHFDSGLTKKNFPSFYTDLNLYKKSPSSLDSGDPVSLK